MAPQSRICDLSAALKRMGGDLPLLEQVVQFVQADAPEFLTRLQTAVVQKDAAEVQSAAHGLKGLVVNIDADAVSQLAFRLEQMAQSGNLACADAVLRELEHEIAALLRELKTRPVAKPP